MLLRTFADMMLNRWLLLIWLVCSQQLFAQQLQEETHIAPKEFSAKTSHAFKNGEWLKYKMRYGIFNASFATIEVNETLWEGKTVFHAKGIGKTTGLARLFFKVDDYYDSYFSKGLVKPLFFVRNINEGGYKKNLNIRFNNDDAKAKVTDIQNSKVGVFDTKPNVQDLISFFYFLRNDLDIYNIRKDDFVTVNLFFDESNYGFNFKFLGRETIKTKFGYVKTLKFRPYVQAGRVFSSSESITLWISDDQNKIPLRLQANLRVGSIVADLDQFKGLKNPFEIVVQN